LPVERFLVSSMASKPTSSSSKKDEQTQETNSRNVVQQFTIFPELPLELRCKIWNFALPAPRVLQIRTIVVQATGIESWKVCCEDKDKVPACLLVCHEARVEVLRKYSRVKALHRGRQAVYCDFERDFIYFAFRDFLNSMEQTLKEIDPEQRMKNMVIGELLIDDPSQWPDTAKSIYKLKSLQNLIVDSPEVRNSSVTIQSCQLSQKIRVADRMMVPLWAHYTLLLLIKQLEEFQKTDPTWKAPVMRYMEI